MKPFLSLMFLNRKVLSLLHGKIERIQTSIINGSKLPTFGNLRVKSDFAAHRFTLLPRAVISEGTDQAHTSAAHRFTCGPVISEGTEQALWPKMGGAMSYAASGKTSGPWEKEDWDKVRLVSPPAGLLCMRRGCGVEGTTRLTKTRSRHCWD